MHGDSLQPIRVDFLHRGRDNAQRRINVARTYGGGAYVFLTVIQGEGARIVNDTGLGCIPLQQRQYLMRHP
jgi:hypothetical protein